MGTEARKSGRGDPTDHLVTLLVEGDNREWSTGVPLLMWVKGHSGSCPVNQEGEAGPTLAWGLEEVSPTLGLALETRSAPGHGAGADSLWGPRFSAKRLTSGRESALYPFQKGPASPTLTSPFPTPTLGLCLP